MTANKRIPQISITVPPSPPIAQSPGETITTLSGQATVTRLEQVGNESIAWADYGSGIEQPHTSEAISPHPKGTQFHDKRKQIWTLVAGNAEGATLNRETETGCISSRLTWEEIDRRFTLISPSPDAPPTPRTTTPAPRIDSQRPLEPSCDRCQHQERHTALEGEAYTCKLGHVVGAVMCGGVMAQSYPQICKAYAENPQWLDVGVSDLEVGDRLMGKPVFGGEVVEGQFLDMKALRHRGKSLRRNVCIETDAGDKVLLHPNGLRRLVPLNPPNSGDLDSPLEREAIRAEASHDAIARLEQERDTIKSEGTIAPEGCWIETGKVKGRNFRQAWWRSTKPLFIPKRSRGNVEAKTKSCYIGQEGSPEHKEAIAQRERRDRLKAIERQIQILMEEAECLS